MQKRFIIWEIKEGKVGSLIIIIILKVEEATKIKILGGNKMLVHLTSKDFFNNKNNHYILQFQKD